MLGSGWCPRARQSRTGRPTAPAVRPRRGVRCSSPGDVPDRRPGIRLAGRDDPHPVLRQPLPVPCRRLDQARPRPERRALSATHQPPGLELNPSRSTHSDPADTPERHHGDRPQSLTSRPAQPENPSGEPLSGLDGDECFRRAMAVLAVSHGTRCRYPCARNEPAKTRRCPRRTRYRC